MSIKTLSFVTMLAIVRSSPLCTNHVINSKSLEPWITQSGSQTSLDTLANTPLWGNNRALFDIFAVKRPEDMSSLWKLYQELIECYLRRKPLRMSKSPQDFPFFLMEKFDPRRFKVAGSSQGIRHSTWERRFLLFEHLFLSCSSWRNIYRNLSQPMPCVM